MRRREFIAGLGAGAAWPVVARAQRGERVHRIGVLMAGDENDPVIKTRVSAFTQALADLGWTDGRNVRIDLRWASLDASRLARNNRDWHQLLELCSVFGVLIADGERLYDPCAYHDRLLLGLSGIMSEAELHQIRMRLHQGERQKASRGELRLPLPAGLTHLRDGTVTFNPDEEVQERLRLVFAKFRELRSAKAVMRYLRRNKLLIPVRPLHGPAPHDLVWRAADSARVMHILKNPAYAGAY